MNEGLKNGYYDQYIHYLTIFNTLKKHAGLKRTGMLFYLAVTVFSLRSFLPSNSKWHLWLEYPLKIEQMN